MTLNTGLRIGGEGARAEAEIQVKHLLPESNPGVVCTRVGADKECQGLALDSVSKEKLPGFPTNGLQVGYERRHRSKMTEVSGPKNQEEGSCHELRWQRKTAQGVGLREDTGGGWVDGKIRGQPQTHRWKRQRLRSPENFRTNLCKDNEDCLVCIFS